MEAEAAGDVAGVGAAPGVPGGEEGVVATLVLFLAVGAEHLRLHLDAAGADHVDLGCALGLAGVGVVADEGAAAVAQHLEAAPQLGVGACIGCEEVSGEAIPLSRVEHAPAGGGGA